MSCKRTCFRLCLYDAGEKKVVCFDKSGANIGHCPEVHNGEICKAHSFDGMRCPAFKAKEKK